jgi:hypothetical protein
MRVRRLFACLLMRTIPIEILLIQAKLLGYGNRRANDLENA